MSIPLKTVQVNRFSLRDIASEVFRRMPPETKYEPKEIALLTADDLMSFASKCKREYPQIVSSSVYCEILSDKAAFRITQLMLDVDGKAVKSPNGGEPVGRILLVHSFDERIHAKIGGTLPTEFNFQLV